MLLWLVCWLRMLVVRLLGVCRGWVSEVSDMAPLVMKDLESMFHDAMYDREVLDVAAMVMEVYNIPPMDDAIAPLRTLVEATVNVAMATVLDRVFGAGEWERIVDHQIDLELQEIVENG